MRNATTEQTSAASDAGYEAIVLWAFARLAPWYDALTFPARALHRDIVTAMSAPPSSRILDVATGTGSLARSFARQGHAVTGVDLSDAMIGVAKRRRAVPGLSFMVADASQLPFAAGAFQFTAVSFALHDMPRAVRLRVLGEMARVTEPGGGILIVDYALPDHRATAYAAERLIARWESPWFPEFIRSDVGADLENAGGLEIRKESRWLGTVQVITGRVGVARVSPDHERGGRHDVA